MLKENLMMLRNIHGYSQEEIAEKIGVSRQAYARWEAGTSLPDIEKSRMLAAVYGVSIDSLVSGGTVEGVGRVPPGPEGKHIWGSVMMNERGQIVIPKAARESLGLTGSRRMIVLSDEEGIAMIEAEAFEKKMQKIMAYASRKCEE